VTRANKAPRESKVTEVNVGNKGNVDHQCKCVQFVLMWLISAHLKNMVCAMETGGSTGLLQVLCYMTYHT
jgi:hypothetical protein